MGCVVRVDVSRSLTCSGLRGSGRGGWGYFGCLYLFAHEVTANWPARASVYVEGCVAGLQWCSRKSGCHEIMTWTVSATGSWLESNSEICTAKTMLLLPSLLLAIPYMLENNSHLILQCRIS